MTERQIIVTVNELVKIKHGIREEVTGFGWKLPAIDKAIELIVKQQTKIMELEYLLGITKEENEAYEDLLEHSPDWFKEDEIKLIKELINSFDKED